MCGGVRSSRVLPRVRGSKVVRVRCDELCVPPRAPDVCVRAPQADRWYSQDLRGGTEAEARVLALLVARFAANGAALTWAVDVLADADGYVDGAPWIPPKS